MVSDRARAAKGREYRQGDHVCQVYNTPAEQLNDGYTGLRTCGDMSWLLDETI